MYPDPRHTNEARAHRPRRTTASLILCLLVACTGGCIREHRADPMASAYYINPYKNLNTLGRVALVELENNSAYPEVSAEVTQALFVALQKKQIFGVTVVPQDDPQWRGLQENLDTQQTFQNILEARKALRCNGLLIGTITQYEPYPRMAIGLRLKLVDLTDGQLLWGLEQVWDTADQSIEQRVEDYTKRQTRSGAAALRQELVVVSALRFAKFVAYEVAETLDPSDDESDSSLFQR